MSISSKIALAMSADGASFEEVHDSLEKITDKFAIEFGEWLMKKGRYNITNWSKTTEELLEVYKKEKEV